LFIRCCSHKSLDAKFPISALPVLPQLALNFNKEMTLDEDKNSSLEITQPAENAGKHHICLLYQI
jgi:hypothetical protein